MMNVSSDMHAVARSLLDAVQLMDAAIYRAIAPAIDGRLFLEMQGDVDNRDLRDLALLVRAMRLIMTERAVTSESIDPELERVRTLYNDAKPELLRIVQEFGLDINAPRPLHTLAMHIQLDTWPLEGRDRDIVTALDRAYQELLRASSLQSAQPDVHEREAPESDAMPQAGESANAGSGDETYALARSLLDAVQQMDATAYQALVVNIDSLMLDEQRVANDRDLRDLALLARAMRLPMIEHAAGSELPDDDREWVRTVYDDALLAFRGVAQEFGLEISAHRPMHALAMHIQLDTWPLEGRDRDIVTALERAYQEFMNRHQTSRNPHAGGRRSR